MRGLAGNGYAGYFIFALAVEGALVYIWDVLNSGGRGDKLKGRAGGESGGETAVEVRPVRDAVFYIQRVDRRSRDHAEKLAGLIVADEHRGVMLRVEKLVYFIVEPCVDGESEGAVLCARRAGEETEAVHIAAVAREDASAGAPPIVAGDVVV